MASIKANCRKVICIGRNYADHITELSSARPKQPFFFLKPPTSILPPHTGPIIRPRGVSLHYEVELAAIIGSGGPYRNLPADDDTIVEKVVQSYCLAIDLTARNVQDEAKRKGLPWSIAKGFDTFCPVSKAIPASRIPDPHALELWLSVNGEVRQSDGTDLMLFRMARILSDVSRVMSLEEGDLLLTGTPKGVGEIRGGDVVKAGVKDSEGRDIEEGSIEVEVRDAEGDDIYEFRET